MRYLILSISLIFLAACTSDAPASTNPDATVTSATSTSPSGETYEKPNIGIEVKNMSPGDVFLIGTLAGSNYRVDSTSLDASGKLRFQPEDAYIPGLYFVYFPNNATLQLLIDKDQTMEIKTDAADFTATTQVEGNLDTKLLHENFRYESDYRSKLGPVNDQLKSTPKDNPQYKVLKKQQKEIAAKRDADLDKIFKQHPNSFFTSFKRAGQNPPIVDVRNPDGSVNNKLQVYMYRTQFWDNVDFSDNRLMYTPVVSNKLKKYIETLTTQQSDSIVAAATYLIDKSLNYPEYFKYFANYITRAYEPTKTTLMDGEKVYVRMIQKYFTKERAFWAEAAVSQGLQQRAGEMAASLTGLKGPDVIAIDHKGAQKSIYELKSDYIVVYLYTPTCEHCQEQTPKLINLFNRKNRSELDVYAIAVDTNDKEWRDYVKKTGMPFAAVFDPSNRAIYGKYYVDVTPEVYVLNKDRTIIGKNLKVEQVEEIIARDKNRK